MPARKSHDRTGRARPPGPGRVILAFLALVALVVGLLGYLTLPGRGPGPAARTVEARERFASAPINRVMGDRACQECHPTEARQHRRSGHANALRPAADVAIARWLDGRKVADPEAKNVRWAYSLRNGRLGVDRLEGRRVDRMDFDFAFGSGEHATTFVSLLPGAPGASPGSRESRLTYFVRDHAFDITPAQKATDHSPGVNPMGRDRDPNETLHCFACHVTTFSDHDPRKLDVATMRAGVGCERCHGPGEAHIAAARRGESDPSISIGKVWTSDGQMQLCGECHRHPSQASPGQIRPENRLIVRFQPVGLMQSACYTRSEGALSCVTCHDPHSRASTDRASYEAACLSCHAPSRSPLCPVSPRRNCIACHMPALDTGLGINFTDHWVRVRRDLDGAGEKAPAPPP